MLSTSPSDSQLSPSFDCAFCLFFLFFFSPSAVDKSKLLTGRLNFGSLTRKWRPRAPFKTTRPFRSVHFSPRDRFPFDLALPSFSHRQKGKKLPWLSARFQLMIPTGASFVHRHCLPSGVTFSSGSGSFTANFLERIFFFFFSRNISKRLPTYWTFEEETLHVSGKLVPTLCVLSRRSGPIFL